jgi:hypothetical protein
VPSKSSFLASRQTGAPFRPSDWADRLCGVMSIFGEDQRISYSPYVNPSVADGHKCVRVDTRLKALNPDAFAFLMGFARDNELRLHAPRRGGGPGCSRIARLTGDLGGAGLAAGPAAPAGSQLEGAKTTQAGSDAAMTAERKGSPGCRTGQAIALIAAARRLL